MDRLDQQIIATDQQIIATIELKEGEVLVERATTPEQKIGRLEVVTQRYLHVGYLKGIFSTEIPLLAEDIVGDDGFSVLAQELPEKLFEEFMKNGILLHTKDEKELYMDKYHWQSTEFVAIMKMGDKLEYVGSVRIIEGPDDSDKNMRFGLPTLTDEKIEIDDQWREEVYSINAELSQFAKLKGTPSIVSVALLRKAAEYSRRKAAEYSRTKIAKWVATTDDRVVELLNGDYFNFGLPKIGPSRQYLGSQSTPILIDIEKALNNAEREEKSRPTARFIRGEPIEGEEMKLFSWYVERKI